MLKIVQGKPTDFYLGAKMIRPKKQLIVFEVMSMEGFEFPDLLGDLRKDIDFGLFSVNASDELDAIISTEVDPFTELGIEL
jgi:hypothetical protein